MVAVKTDDSIYVGHVLFRNFLITAFLSIMSNEEAKAHFSTLDGYKTNISAMQIKYNMYFNEFISSHCWFSSIYRYIRAARLQLAR